MKGESQSRFSSLENKESRLTAAHQLKSPLQDFFQRLWRAIIYATSLQRKLLEILISQSLPLFAIVLSKAGEGFSLCTISWLILQHILLYIDFYMYICSIFFENQDSFHSMILSNVASFFYELKLDVSTPTCVLKWMGPSSQNLLFFFFLIYFTYLGNSRFCF